MEEKKPRKKHPRTAIDMEDVLQRVESGESYLDIADALGISRSLLHIRLEETPEILALSARAKEKSAEAWLDKGLAVIASSLSKNGDIDASAARAYAQECARRAAIRNPRYRDKVDQTLSAPDGGPVRFAKEMSDAELAAIAAGKVSSRDTK